MDDSTKLACADMVFTDAVSALAGLCGVSVEDARSQLIESGAYDALYDLETELWKGGPDYFIAYHRDLVAAGGRFGG